MQPSIPGQRCGAGVDARRREILTDGAKGAESEEPAEVVQDMLQLQTKEHLKCKDCFLCSCTKPVVDAWGVACGFFTI